MFRCENLFHYQPSDEEYEKFERINSMTDEQWEHECTSTNDCSICRMAIHQYLTFTTKHTCVYGMTRERFESAMDNADCSF